MDQSPISVKRFALAAGGLAMVGAAIGYSVDDELMDAGIGAILGVVLVVWATVKALREQAAERNETFIATARPFVLWTVGLGALLLAGFGGYFGYEASQDEAGFLWRDSSVELTPLRTLKGAQLGERVPEVSYECARPDATRVNRVGCHDRESRIVHVFGNAARRLCSKVEGVYAFDVLDTGTRYVVADGRVTSFAIMEPQALETALGGDRGWRRC